MNRFALLFLILSPWTLLAAELYDRVEAVVGTEVILRSELLDAVQVFRTQPGFGQLRDLELRKRVLKQLIDDKVLIARAEIDSIFVTPEELDQQVEDHMTRIARRQRMTMTQLAAAIKQQMGIDMATYRKRLRAQIKEQTIIRKMQRKYVGEVVLTPKEVERFYEEYRDSLPPLRNVVRLAQIQLKILPKVSELEKARNSAVEVLAQLDRGGDFVQLAATRSGDAMTASSGGDLGYVRRGTLDPRLERVAFSLESGEYSRAPVYTRSGYHIVKLLDRRDAEIRPAHILFPVEPSAEDTLTFRILADSLHKVIANDSARFVQQAAEHSDDEVTKRKGGDLGWFLRSELEPLYANAVASLKVGEVSAPMLLEDSWYLIRLVDAADLRPLNLEDDWSQIEQYARSLKMQRKMQEQTEKWHHQVLIEIRDPALR